MFNRRLVVVGIILAVSSTAWAGGVIELSPLTPENGPGGVDYLPGSVVDFQVVENANLVYDVLGGEIPRRRPWRAGQPLIV